MKTIFLCNFGSNIFTLIYFILSLACLFVILKSVEFRCKDFPWVIFDESVFQFGQIKTRKLSTYLSVTTSLRFYRNNTDAKLVFCILCPPRQYKMCVNIDPCNILIVSITHQIVGVELVVEQGLLGVPLALGELQVEGDDGDGGWDQSQHYRGHHVGQREDTQDKEVEGEQQVDVLLAEDLKKNVLVKV